MDLDNLESRHLKSPKDKQPLIQRDSREAEEASQSQINEDGQANDAQASSYHRRSDADWKLIMKLACLSSAFAGLVLGLLLGFYAGRTTSAPATEAPDDEISIYEQYDYSKFVINNELGVTIDTLYNSAEEKYHAMNIIGTKVPVLSYLNQTDEALTNEELNTGDYIIELIEPTCGYCKKMVDTIHEYTSLDTSVPVIGLSLDEGDLKEFNKYSETYFRLIQKDDDTKAFVEHVVWIPTLVFVSNGTVRMVAYGSTSLDEMVEYTQVAFNIEPDTEPDTVKEE